MQLKPCEDFRARCISSLREVVRICENQVDLRANIDAVSAKCPEHDGSVMALRQIASDLTQTAQRRACAVAAIGLSPFRNEHHVQQALLSLYPHTVDGIADTYAIALALHISPPENVRSILRLLVRDRQVDISTKKLVIDALSAAEDRDAHSQWLLDLLHSVQPQEWVAAQSALRTSASADTLVAAYASGHHRQRISEIIGDIGTLSNDQQRRVIAMLMKTEVRDISGTDIWMLGGIGELGLDAIAKLQPDHIDRQLLDAAIARRTAPQDAVFATKWRTVNGLAARIAITHRDIAPGGSVRGYIEVINIGSKPILVAKRYGQETGGWSRVSLSPILKNVAYETARVRYINPPRNQADSWLQLLRSHVTSFEWEVRTITTLGGRIANFIEHDSVSVEVVGVSAVVSWRIANWIPVPTDDNWIGEIEIEPFVVGSE